MEQQDTEGQRLAAEFMAEIAKRPVSGRYPVATSHSTTERGGQVIASSTLSTDGGRVALVGDTVRYPDGSQTHIVTGSGTHSPYFGRPLALVGSVMENGDRITGPMHDGLVLVDYADQSIPGLFHPSTVAPKH